MAIQVLLADSHLVFRQRLKSLLAWEGLEVVAEAADGREALFRAKTTRPQIAVLDLASPRKNGIDTAREIMQPGGRMIVFISGETPPGFSLDPGRGLDGLEAGTWRSCRSPEAPTR